MKYCPKCGEPAEDSDEFCSKCGAYFTNEAAPVQQPTGAAAAAMGMTAAPARPKPVPVPEGGTLDAGFDHMRRGNFPEGIAQWTSVAREGGQPSEEDYRRMVDAMGDCIIRSVGDGQPHSRAGIAELDIELEGSLLEDLMADLLVRAEGLESRTKLADLASEYMYLAMETFSVYPDLRDVNEVMAGVPEKMEVFRTAAESAAEDDNGRLDRVLETYKAFPEFICGGMSKAIQDAGDEKMEKLSDYWSEKATLPYTNMVYQMANLYTQVNSANGVGRMTKRLFTRGLDMQLDGFIRSYFGPKV